MLSLKQLEKYIHGALRIWEEDGWFRFSRFTENQDKILDTRGAEFRKLASAGMRLEFTTLGGNIEFSYRSIKANGGPNQYFSVEITENGLPVYNQYTNELPRSGQIVYKIPQKATPVHIAIYFPSLATFDIKDVKLPEDISPVSKDLKLLALGDSITQGAVSIHPNHTYANLLADRLNAELINQGVGGEVFYKEVLENIPFSPDVITVAYGVNDHSEGLLNSPRTEEYLEKLYELYPDKPIFVLLPIWSEYGTEKKKGFTLEDGRIFLQKATERFPNMTAINCYSFVPHLPEFYWDDINCHPNDLGFIYYEKHLAKPIMEALFKK